MKILEIDYKFITRIYQTLPLEKKKFFKKTLRDYIFSGHVLTKKKVEFKIDYIAINLMI